MLIVSCAVTLSYDERILTRILYPDSLCTLMSTHRHTQERVGLGSGLLAGDVDGYEYSDGDGGDIQGRR